MQLSKYGRMVLHNQLLVLFDTKPEFITTKNTLDFVSQHLQSSCAIPKHHCNHIIDCNAQSSMKNCQNLECVQDESDPEDIDGKRIPCISRQGRLRNRRSTHRHYCNSSVSTVSHQIRTSHKHKNWYVSINIFLKHGFLTLLSRFHIAHHLR